MDNNFVKNNLLPNEKILATAQWHWMKWMVCLIVFGILLFLDIIMHIIGETIFEEDGFFLAILFGCIILGIGGTLLTKYISSFDEFVITNMRIIAKVGIIRRRSFELYYDQVESVEVIQGVWGRFLNYGAVMPHGIGASNVSILYVVDPYAFRQHFYDLKKQEPKAKEQPTIPTQKQTTKQKYFSQPMADGRYCVAEMNFITGELVAIKSEVFPTEYEAKQRAKELNVEYCSEV